MKKIDQIYQAIEKKIDLLPSDLEDKYRRMFYFILLIIGPPAMLLFAINGLLKGDLFLFVSLVLLAAGVVSGWLFLLKPQNGLLAYRINTGAYALVLLYILMIGGGGGSKLLWSYTFPLIAIFLFGNKEGVAWTLVYLAAALSILYPDWNLSFQYAYHPELKFRFICTYTLVAAISYWFEHLRNEYRQKLEAKNTTLAYQIAETRKVQQALEQSEKMFRSIFDKAGVGVSLTCSKTGKLLRVNKKYSEILGYPVHELEKSTFQETTHPDDLDADLKNLNDLIAGKTEGYAMEKRHFLPDGTIVWIHLSVSPILEKNQHIGIIQDITQRKALEEEVQKLEGIIPICSSCKKIRDDEGYWNKIESYIQAHSDASFSHSMCPECSDRFYGKEDWYIKMKKKKS